jgi:hypothetical protein
LLIASIFAEYLRSIMAFHLLSFAIKFLRRYGDKISAHITDERVIFIMWREF